MDAQHIKTLVESNIPGSQATAVLDNSGNLDLKVLCEASGRLEAHRKIMSAISNPAFSEKIHTTKLEWFPKEKYKDIKEVKKVNNFREAKALIESALAPLFKNNIYCSGVDIKSNRSILTVFVTSPLFPSSNKEQEVRQTIFRNRDKILDLVEAKQIHISCESGLPSYPLSYAGYDDEDEDDNNPNWPSTTGNPSGPGRGNNPPRR